MIQYLTRATQAITRSQCAENTRARLHQRFDQARNEWVDIPEDTLGPLRSRAVSDVAALPAEAFGDPVDLSMSRTCC